VLVTSPIGSLYLRVMDRGPTCTYIIICSRKALRSEGHGILLAVIIPFVLYCDHNHEMHAGYPSLKNLSNATRNSHSNSS
jgi:hypothetical protein